MKTKLALVIVIILFQFCNAQQSKTTLPKVENHLLGELDYTHEALELVQNHINGEEVLLGNITKEGTVIFTLPEFKVKSHYESIPLRNDNFKSLFLMQGCKDNDAFTETPFDSIYAKKYNPIFIKKYGIQVAVLEPLTNEKIVKNNQYSNDTLAIGSTFFWFYMDRAITFKDKCLKTSFNGTYDIEVTIAANIEFEKGWNFIKENLVEIQNYSRGDYQSNVPQKIEFTKSSPSSKDVKWFIRQITEDEKIKTAKKLHNITPISKDKFEKWTPNTLGDLSITTKEHGKPPEGQNNTNNMHLIYTHETEKSEIDLYVVDCAKNPDDMEMVNFAYAMENRGKDKKDIKPYVAQYSERRKATQLLYVVDDRIIVNASGVNINSEELWNYIQKLNIEKLLEK